MSQVLSASAKAGRPLGDLALTSRLLFPMFPDQLRVAVGRQAPEVFLRRWSARYAFWERANRALGAGEEFDITTEPGGRPLTFGAGPHFCLGSNLARAELEEAIGFLAPRMRDLRPAAPAELDGVEGIYGVESLPLAWSQV